MNRKLFFGLFVFPLLIAVGMAVLLCSVVLMTHEEQSPESLVAAIKTTSPGKRWQKAFELSNELNRLSSDAPAKEALRSGAILHEIIQILGDPSHYDSKTRGYMALALGHFNQPEAINALKNSLTDPSEDVALYAMWSLGNLKALEAGPQILSQLQSEKSERRKTAAYVLGALGQTPAIPEIKKLLNDESLDVRWNAALALARLKDDSGTEVLYKMLEREELKSQYAMSDEAVEAVMINATKGLALIQKADSIKILESVSRNDKSLKVRQAAVEALQYIGRNQ